MNDAILVRMLDTVANHCEQFETMAYPHRVPPAVCRERFSVDEFHGEVRSTGAVLLDEAGLEDLRHRRMLQRGKNLGFKLESSPGLIVEAVFSNQLQSNPPPGLCLLGLKHASHTARGDQALYQLARNQVGFPVDPVTGRLVESVLDEALLRR
jgi:hypothetical protein